MLGLNSYLLLSALLLLSLRVFLKDKAKKLIETSLLIVCTLCTALFFQQTLKADARSNKLAGMVSEERAESTLRLMSTINVGLAKVYEVFGPLKDNSGKRHNAIDVGNTGLGIYFDKARISLEEAIKSSPDNAKLKAKLIILDAVSGKHKSQLQNTCNSLIESKNEADAALGGSLRDIYLNRKVSSQDLAAHLLNLQTGIPKGWYQDNAIMALYRVSGQFKSYESFIDRLEESYAVSFRTGIAIVVFGTFSAFVGLVVIIIQLGSLSRRDAPALPESEKLGLDLDMRTIYSVFVGWISCELAIGEITKLLPKNALSLGSSPVGIAGFSFLAYLLTMLPALVLIYLLALKPRGLKPMQALRIRFQTPGMGPVKLLLCGFLAWCAIIPLVLLGAALASVVFGSQGSDNPVLPQIAQIASSGNLLAISLLFLTVAVMAPFCEEIVFRGFLYAALRSRFGVFPAILLSALIFAAIHCDKGGLLMLFALGPVLALAFERTRSLLTSMIAHGLWNGGSFAFMLLLFLG